MRQLTKQEEAYRLVYCWPSHTHQQAGEIMGVCRSAVTHLLKRLKKNQPNLFNEKRPKRGKIQHLRACDERHIRRKF